MTIILGALNGADLQVNQWTWRPTTFLIGKALGLDATRTEKLTVNGIGESISVEEASRLAEFLDAYLADFPRNGGLLLNGSVTTDCKSSRSGTDSYFAGYDWLIRFQEFCRMSGGFKII